VCKFLFIFLLIVKGNTLLYRGIDFLSSEHLIQPKVFVHRLGIKTSYVNRADVTTKWRKSACAP
jgi:hypothetical protein